MNLKNVNEIINEILLNSEAVRNMSPKQRFSDVFSDITARMEKLVEMLVESVRTFQISESSGLVYIVNKKFIDGEYRISCFYDNKAASHVVINDKREAIKRIYEIIPVYTPYEIEFII